MLHLLSETFQKFPRRSFTFLECIHIWLQLGSLIYSNRILLRNFVFMWEMLLSTQLKKKYSHILNLSKMCNGLVSILHVSLHLNGRTSISSAVYHSAISGFTTPKMWQQSKWNLDKSNSVNVKSVIKRTHYFLSKFTICFQCMYIYIQKWIKS